MFSNQIEVEDVYAPNNSSAQAFGFGGYSKKERLSLHPNSTKATDKRNFIPMIDESMNDDLQDISGIVGDISNVIQETSFATDIQNMSIINKNQQLSSSLNQTPMTNNLSSNKDISNVSPDVALSG